MKSLRVCNNIGVNFVCWEFCVKSILPQKAVILYETSNGFKMLTIKGGSFYRFSCLFLQKHMIIVYISIHDVEVTKF